jgi:hypothetical protein
MAVSKTSKTKTKAVAQIHAAAQPSEGTTKSIVLLTHEMIAQRAREIWERKGRPCGQDEQNWLEAEALLHAELAKS